MMAEHPDDLYDVPDPEQGPDTSQLPNVEELRSDVALAGRESKRKRNFIVLGVVLVSIALIIGVSVGVSQSKKSEASPSTVSAGPEDDWADIEASRIRAVTNFVIDNDLSTKTAVETIGSPQNKAVDFMALGDEAQFDIPLEMADTDAFKFVQRYALAVFYYSLGGVDWLLDLNQLTKDDTCQWYSMIFISGRALNFGVACNDKGEVIYLVMPPNNMKGTLPDEIVQLSSITFFAVMGNGNITGPIPDAFRKLSNIEFLELSANALTGSIPDWIGELAKLRDLALGDNQLMSTIPSSMKKLSNLEWLSLDGNMLTGDIETLESLTGLMYLYLEHNMLSQRINGTTLDGLTKLKQLDLSDNEFVGIVPEHFLGLSALGVLDLSDNLLAGSLPEFSPNTALNFFAVHNCSLTGTIPESIGHLSALNHLDLSENKLTGEIPSTLGNLTSLTYLFLSYNDLDPGPIPEFIQDLQFLADLSLKGTNRNGSIPSWFGEMQYLLMLDLHRNELTGKIPSELTNAPFLALLLLNRNLLSGTIPDGFENMSNLVMLMLDNNTITGPTTSVCQAPRLRVFSADCGGENPKVECPGSCCTLCCDGVKVCNDGGLLAQVDPIWEDQYQRTKWEFGDNLTFYLS